MAKPSPPIRQAGNIGHLLVIRGVCRRSLRSACAHVKYRCRCRVKANLASRMQVASTTREAIPRPTALPEARTEVPVSDASQVSLKPDNFLSDKYVARSNIAGYSAGYSDKILSLLHFKTTGYRIMTMFYCRSDTPASIAENVCLPNLGKSCRLGSAPWN